MKSSFNFLASLSCAALVFAVSASAQPAATISPATWAAGQQYIGRPYTGVVITVHNTGTTTQTITSFSVTPPFQWAAGLSPQVLTPHQTAKFTVTYYPTVAGPSTGTFSATLDGLANPLTVALSGSAVVSNAGMQITPTTVNFTQAVGGSQNQTVTLKNTGTAAVTMQGVNVIPFTVTYSGATNITIGAGQSQNLTLTYAPSAAVTQYGTARFSFDSLPDFGVGLVATGKAAAGLAVSSTALMPGATQGFTYQYAMTALLGTKPYVWSATSPLPAGLTMNSNGLISGTLSNSVAVGNQSWTAQVQDSSVPPKIATKSMLVPVNAPPGGACNDIVFNIAGTSSPLVPMDILGAGKYMGYTGGLYLNGSNVMPSDHLNYGIGLANAIQPLDANGNPDPNGKYVLLSIGMSIAKYEWDNFLAFAQADPTLNKNMVVVEGAQGAETANELADVNSFFWNNMITYSLPYAGVTPQQVVAIWMNNADDGSVTFPTNAENYHSHVRSIAQGLLSRFPNLKMWYIDSRGYAGYSNGVSSISPEPFAYEEAFGIQEAINDQLNGDPTLNFDPSKGPVVAPWLAWANYKWGNGLTPHNGGLVWACPDYMDDGFHPAKVGREKASTLLMQFFKTNATAAPWFLAH